MQETAASGDPLRRLAIQVGLYAGAFAAGALFAFLYSYFPLHDAKNWQIDYLEERLLAKDGEIAALQQQVASLEAASGERPDGRTFDVLEGELVTAEKTVKRLEEQVARLEQRAKESERARDDWKARHAELERDAARLASRATQPSDARAATQPAPPASPAPVTEPSDASGGESVAIGTRWRSPDRRADFDLVSVQGDRARVIPNASSLLPGVAPTVLDVAAGDRFEIVAAGGARRSVRVTRVDASSGIAIEVSP